MPPSSEGRSGPGLIESLRWDGGFHRLDRHLRRLAASAERLGHPVDLASVRERLDEVVSGLAGGVPHKVRLELAPDGGLEVEAAPIRPLPEPVPVLLVDVRLDPSDELLRHKTTRRGTYETERCRASEEGFREVLFRNTRGEVTEGSFTNVFVRAGRSLYTPPVSCGLLPGVMREVLLETREGAEERVLLPRDLLSADAVWLCNSVRGTMRAELTVEGPT